MPSRKIIKKLGQLSAFVLLLLIAIPATGFLLLKNQQIQNSIQRRITLAISEQTGTLIKIGKIDISILYRIRLSDVYLEDSYGDTLIYAETLTTGIRSLNPVKKEISVGSIHFDKALVSLSVDSTYMLNLKDFIQKLKSDKDKKKGGWTVQLNNIRLQDSRFHFRHFKEKPPKPGMNYQDIMLSDIDAELKHFTPGKDSLFFNINSLSFKDKGGFVVNEFIGNFSQSKTFMSFRDIDITTPYSRIKGDEVTFRFDRWSKFKADSFANEVKLSIRLDDTDVNLKDIGYFTPVFYQTDQMVELSANVTGPVSNIKAKDVKIRFGENSRLFGDLRMEGLPDIDETFILADFQEMTTTASDLQDFQLPDSKIINLSDQFNKLGLITFKGNFTGFVNDFVTYGSFTTDLGVVITDLLLRPDTSDYIDFEGSLNAMNFELGPLFTPSAELGKLSLSGTINGTTLGGKSVNADMNINVQKLVYRNYEYKNILLEGQLNNKNFDGSVNIHDPNIEFEFMGKVNMSDSIPVFDFSANITDVNFYALNLDKSDPDFKASFYLIANATGNSVNTINGNIKLLNSLFTRKDKQLQIYDLALYAENTAERNRIELRSDFIDAELSGKYELDNIQESLKYFISTYLPSLTDSVNADIIQPDNEYNITATVKNAKPIFDFFLPEYGMAENSNINIQYTPYSQSTYMLLISDWIQARGIRWNNLSMLIEGDSSRLSFDAGGQELVLGDRITLENFTILSGAGQDSANILLRWNNWSDLEYRGTIESLVIFTANQNNDPSMNIQVLPTRVITNDSIWNIQAGNIRIDKERLTFDNVSVIHKNEYFSINGTVTNDPDEKLDLQFYQFNLRNLDGITNPSGYWLEGILNGTASISNSYNSTLFTSNLLIDSLIINSELLGNAEISSIWDERQKSLNMDGHIIRDDLKTIAVKGEYMPAEDGKLDFDIEFDKLRMNVFDPYVSSIFGDLRGLASGKATLKGTASRPLLNGEFNLQRSIFTINYLQTRYEFTDKVQIENNNIFFKDIRIFDPKGNSAFLTGAIRSSYLKDFNLDLTIRSEEFLCMDTKETDNKLFYGTAFARELTMKIYGPPKRIVMDITATTAPNTVINFPMTNEGKLDEYPFITIHNYNNEEEEESDVKDYTVDLSGLQLNFDLNVTPDAEVQIIFDPMLGDKIKGRGTGNLDMKINTAGNFLMFGEYLIDRGNYLFTLQSFINRDLTIEPGGTIKWNGDPLDATVNIVAYYRTKASLNDLYGTEDEVNTKIWVHDRITMSGKLMQPDLKYDIYLPDADASTRLKLNNAIASSEELNKQFISLLTLNRFVPSATAGQTPGGNSSATYSSVAGVNVSEFLSNQLSNWLSQISKDVDVNINYSSDRELKSEEVQVALSTQLFNNRLTVNGSVDVATNAAVNASDNIVGEFDIDYKLTKNGKLRVKTFNHINNDMLYESATYTQGLGFMYKEEFNTLGELWRRYWKSVFGKKEEEPKPAEEVDESEKDTDG